MLQGFSALPAADFLLWQSPRFLNWRKETTLSLRDQLMILLPLTALSLALTIPMLPAAFSTWPVRRTKLKELTAPVESVEASRRTVSAGQAANVRRGHLIRYSFRDMRGFCAVKKP